MTSHENPPVPRRFLLAAALASALAPLNSTMLSVALPPIGQTFDASDGTLTQALVTSYLVTSIVMQAPGGLLGDRLGHRRVLLLGQLLFALGSLLGVAAPALGWLVVARVAMAAGGALIVPSAMALVRTELPPELRGRAFGVFGATMSLAAALGPLIGGQVTSLFGWRALFAVNLLVLPVCFVLLGPRGPERARQSPPRGPFDLAGATVFAAALGALVAGAGASRSGQPIPWLLGASAGLLVVFALVERRAAAPIVDLGLLRRRAFAAGGVIVALHNLAMYALLFELPAVCGALLHAGPAETGPLLIAVMAPMVVVSPFAGRLADGLGARSVALLGTVVAAAGMAYLRWVPIESLASPIPGLLTLGVGLSLTSAPAQSAGMSAVPAAQSGAAAGLLSTMRYLGGVAGTLLLGVVAATSTDRGAVLAAHETAVTLFLAALLAAIPCAALLPSQRPRT